MGGCVHELNPSGCMHGLALLGDFVGGGMYGLAYWVILRVDVYMGLP